MTPKKKSQSTALESTTLPGESSELTEGQTVLPPAQLIGDQAADLEVHEESSSGFEAVLTHAQHVCDLALTLFDRTSVLHDLDESDRRVLEIAALIHHVPFPSGKRKPIKAARKLIAAQVFEEPLTTEQQDLLAAVTAFQHGQLKRGDIQKLDLSPIQQREALTMAALLRIAIGLDQSGSQQTTVEQIELARSELWVVIAGPQSEVDAAAAQHNARLWSKIGYPAVRILLPAEAQHKLMPFPEPSDVIGVLADDTYAEAGRKVFRYHFAETLRHEPGTRLGEDIEALHDMRVATRRLRAAFDVFGPAFEREELKHHRTGLRATGQALGKVRDLDVMLEKAQQYLDKLPEADRSGLDPLLDYWKVQREAARGEMLLYLNSQDYQDFKREFNVFVNTPGAGARPAVQNPPEPQLVSEIAPILIFTRVAAVRAYGPYLPDAPIERLHALRIEFKKLRYTVEYFREVLGEEAKEAINKFKKIQDHLGDLNDADVARLVLETFLAGWTVEQEQMATEQRHDQQPILAYEQARITEMEELIAAFPPVWEDFNQPEFRHKLAAAITTL